MFRGRLTARRQSSLKNFSDFGGFSRNVCFCFDTIKFVRSHSTMADKPVSSPVVKTTEEASASAPKNASAAKPKVPRAKPTHPKTGEMVVASIKALQERGGSSLQAIKKHIAGAYKVDVEKQAIFIKKYLKSAVASGVLIQTKGKGAAGSFKLSSNKGESAKPKTKSGTKSVTKTVTKPSAKSPKKTAAIKKAAVTKKPEGNKKTVVKKAAPKKAVTEKKISKGPAAKPPKPKSTKTKPAAKTPIKKTKSMVTKRAKPVAAKTKKVPSKKTSAAKK